MTEDKKVSAEAEAEKKIYEVGFHIVPSAPQEEIGTIFSALKDMIEKSPGIITGESSPKMTPLSYTLKKEKAGKYTKYNQAYFGWLKFEIEPVSIEAIDEYFKNQELVLRYLLIKTVKENTMTAPKIPSFSRNKGSDLASNKDVSEEKVEVSDSEIEKALDSAITE